eukprot:1636320-Pyramimonas_sp.AAC.1
MSTASCHSSNPDVDSAVISGRPLGAAQRVQQCARTRCENLPTLEKQLATDKRAGRGPVDGGPGGGRVSAGQGCARQLRGQD